MRPNSSVISNFGVKYFKMSLIKKEATIFNKFISSSQKNPLNPVFPPIGSKFPTTPTYQIEVPRFDNVWLKDESINPTGTHKDRMAWELTTIYKNLLEEKCDQHLEELPRMSIITSGSAACAIQTAFKQFSLPNLKCLVDSSMKKEIKQHLCNIGCEVYVTDLSQKPFTNDDILKLTHNKNGIDITSGIRFKPGIRFYDWLSYEVINQNPEYCFIPYGSGVLYENILNIIANEVTIKNDHDPRFQGDFNIIKNCHFLGSTTKNSHSCADKLYAPYLPFTIPPKKWLPDFISNNYCGQYSSLNIVQEKYFKEAMLVAKKNDINCEYSGISGLALLFQMKHYIPKKKKILIINTGKSIFKTYTLKQNNPNNNYSKDPITYLRVCNTCP